MLNRIFSILGAQWLIHQDTAVSYLPVLIAFVKGQEMLLGPADDKKPYVVAWSDSAQLIPTIGKWNLTDASIPENSVAVIPVDGVICSWNSVDLMTMLRDAQANDSINSILLVVNSPGGMVSQIDLLAGSIKSLTKPTVSVVMGMAASAAMWVISATSYRIATSPIDVIGSIGTKTSIQDYSGLLEKIGIKITDFYATKATRKDEEVRAIKENGDTKPMAAFVDFVNEVFHQAIRENLGIAADSEVFTGAAYFAAKAQELGLINEIGSMDYALAKAYQLGLRNKIINQSKSLNIFNQ
ncbi:MAG: S49 family peptidase [Bacteroidales bacterium]